MLTPGEINSMRETSDSALPGTAVIHAATRASDGQGGITFTYAPVGTAIARLASNVFRGGDQSEDVVGDRVAEVTNWIFTFPHSAVIDADDRVVFNSVTYEVVEVPSWAPWEIAKRVRAVEVD